MSLHRFCSLLSFAIMLILVWAASSSRMVFGSEGFRPISPEELKMASEPQAPGASAIILFRQVDRDDSRAIHEDNYVRIKILTEEGRKYADVEIPYLRDKQNLVGVHARTIKPDGSVVNFEGKAIDQTIVKTKGVKSLAKTFTLPDVQVGGIIEYYYTLDFQDQYLYDSHWILSHELFTKKAKFSLKPYNDSSFNLRWVWQYLPPGSMKPVQGTDNFVRLEVDNIPAFQTEDYMPPENEMKARVNFIYTSATEPFETDANRFWLNRGKKLNGSLESFVKNRKAMEKAVAEMVSPADPPETKLRKIYARVQQLRNTSYEVGKTEQEEKRAKEKDANNVEEVLRNGVGNGVQLTWLYLALVRAAGFEAYGVWVSDRSHYLFQPNLMESARLNTNVVLIKLQGKDIYCDPGAKFAPFGMLPWEETGIQGLRLDKEGTGWVTTAFPHSQDSQIARTAKLKLSDRGELEGQLTVTYTGLKAREWRVEGNNQDEMARQKLLEDEVKTYIPAVSEIELTNKPDWISSAPALVAEFNVKVPGWAVAAGHRALVPVGIFDATEKHIFEHATRIQPIYFEYPYQEVDDVTIEIPPGWEISSLPPGAIVPAHIVEYTLKVDNEKGKVHLARTLNLEILSVEAKYYASLRAFFQTVRKDDEAQIVLQPGPATATK